VFDALTSNRPYKKAFSVERSLEIMEQGRGTHFDPAVLDAFLDSMAKILEIKKQFGE
jgi:putative two-component system response regulator